MATNKNINNPWFRNRCEAQNLTMFLTFKFSKISNSVKKYYFSTQNQIMVKNILFWDKNQLGALKSNFGTKNSFLLKNLLSAQKIHFYSEICFRHQKFISTQKFSFDAKKKFISTQKFAFDTKISFLLKNLLSTQKYELDTKIWFCLKKW